MTDLASRAVDLDLRLVGYFVAVAEHRHFGRAAAELRVAQPSLSRQIRRLEQQIGARLFDRTPQSTRLTEAGEVFLPRAKALLRSAAQATAQTRDAAQPGRITTGYTTTRIITPAVRALRREHPEADVQTLHLEWNQPRDALLDHRVDAVVEQCLFPPTSCTSRSSTTRYCQDLWMRLFQATSVSVDSLVSAGVISTGRSSSLPLWNTAPARTRATKCGALTARHRACAASISL